ncbi:hypothetical protein PPUJ21368_54400 [Pseudomonas putida]|nr:hypothetical protein PPUJ21368_54400 [Pseudomonas putida]
MAIKEAKHMHGRHVFSVTAEDFAEFLQEKTPESICPACGHDDWTVICPPQSESGNAFRMRITLTDGPRPASMSVLGIYCDHCGYIRSHMARVVRTWVDDRQLDLDLDDDLEAELND